MRKDIMSVLDLFREKGYACGYLTTNGTIITEERAEALAELAALGFLEAHQRLDRRSGRAARRRARPEGHVRADVRRAAPPAGGGAPQACAAAGQHQHDCRARDARGAGRDGGCRRGAGRRRHRPEPPDVQHARGGRRNGEAPRSGRRVEDRDVRDVRSRARRRASPHEGRGPRGEVPRAATCSSISVPRSIRS